MSRPRLCTRESGSRPNRYTHAPLSEPLGHVAGPNITKQQSYYARQDTRSSGSTRLPHLFGRDCKPSNIGSKQSVACSARPRAIERQSAPQCPAIKRGPFGASLPHPPTLLRIPRIPSSPPRAPLPSRATYYLLLVSQPRLYHFLLPTPTSNHTPPHQHHGPRAYPECPQGCSQAWSSDPEALRQGTVLRTSEPSPELTGMPYKMVQCDICDEWFAGDLERHKRTHSKDTYVFLRVDHSSSSSHPPMQLILVPPPRV